MDAEASGGERRIRTLGRITAFTDATIAIALTLLVLPLVNIADRSTADQSVIDLLVDNRGDLLAFAVSFLVISQFWRGHRRLYERLVDYDEVLLALNTCWLLMMVFLPFPTARLFVESRLRTDSAVLYLGTMLALSLLALGQVHWVSRRPALRGETAASVPRPPLLSEMAAPAIFAVATLVASASPAAGLLLLIALPPVQAVVKGVVRRR